MFLFQYEFGSLVRDENELPIGILTEPAVGSVIRVLPYKKYIDGYIALTRESHTRENVESRKCNLQR